MLRWGKETERLDVTCNVQQSEANRDALAKGIYARLFDYLVAVKFKTRTVSHLIILKIKILNFEFSSG